MKFRSALFTVLCLIVLTLPAFAAPREIGSGDLLKLVGESRGKVVVVNFFASWCPPCLEEIPGLIRLRGHYKPSQVEFIGVSVDESRDQLVALMGKTPFNYPVFHAREELSRFFGISSIPRLLVYDKAGKLVIDNVGLVEADELAKAIDTLLGGGK